MAPAAKKLVALFDSVGYRNADGLTEYAAAGELFECDPVAAERLLEMGAACSPKEADERLLAIATERALAENRPAPEPVVPADEAPAEDAPGGEPEAPADPPQE